MQPGPHAHLCIVLVVSPLRKHTGAAMVRLDAECSRSDPYALLAADAGHLVLQQMSNLCQGTVVELRSEYLNDADSLSGQNLTTKTPLVSCGSGALL